MRIKVEVPDPEKPKTWRQFETEVSNSKKGNYFFKHLGKPYVFRDLKQGTRILTLIDGKWIEVGRVSYGVAFLGDHGEVSSQEYGYTNEGLQESKRLWSRYQKDLGLWQR